MPHAIWKGAISFGLVHVPVTLYPASQDISVDFDWLDKRSMDPVGYKRVNKVTSKEIDRAAKLTIQKDVNPLWPQYVKEQQQKLKQRMGYDT